MMGNVQEGKKGVVLKEGRDFITVVFHQAGLSSAGLSSGSGSGWAFIRLDSHQAGLSSGSGSRWSCIRLDSHQAGLSSGSGWYFIKLVSHHAGLS